MKIYNNFNRVISTKENPKPENNCLISTPGLSTPGLPMVPNEFNYIGGLNTIGVNEIKPFCNTENLKISGNLTITSDFQVLGDSFQHDITANNIKFFNNSAFFTWGVHIIPKSGTIFTLANKGLKTDNNSLKDETRIWYEGWIYPGFGGYGNSINSKGTTIQNNEQIPNGTDYDSSIPHLGGWSDRSSFPSCNFDSSSNFDYGMAIATSIPFDGWLIDNKKNPPFQDKKIWPHVHNIQNIFHKDQTGECNSQIHSHNGPSSRFSWMLGKYDTSDTNPLEKFVLTLDFYLIKCFKTVNGIKIVGLQPPQKIGRATIKTRCGNAKWGDDEIFDSSYGTVTINAGDGIGIFIVSNNDENNASPTTSTGHLHSPATFTLEVHRKY